jgi:hypothetical protein
LRMLRMSCTKRVPSTTARFRRSRSHTSHSLPEVLDSTGRSNPLLPPHQPLYMSPSSQRPPSRLVVVNSAESRTQRYAPATTRCHHHRIHRCLNSPLTSRPLALRRCLCLRRRIHPPPCPCESPGPLGCSSVKCLTDVVCLYQGELTRSFFGSLSLSHHPLIRFVCHLTYLQTPGNSYSATRTWQRKDQSPSRLAHTPSLASMF